MTGRDDFRKCPSPDKGIVNETWPHPHDKKR